MSGHYSPLKSSQEFLASRHKLPTIPTPKPPSSPYNALSHGTNQSWMNKSGYPTSNTMYTADSSTLWCNQSSQSENADMKMPSNVFQSIDPSAGSQTPHLSSRSVMEVSKTASVNGDMVTVLSVNGTAKPPKPTIVEHGVKKSPVKCNAISPDEVESVLETMFESDIKPPPPVTPVVGLVSAQTCKSALDLIGESVEKILASPSPAKVDETCSEADGTECDKDSSAITPDKTNESSSFLSNGKLATPPKSKLELALSASGEKCDKRSPGSTNKGTSNEETYVEVESELAKMFAGIEDSDTTATVSSSTVVTVNTNTTTTSSSLPNTLPVKSERPEPSSSTSANNVAPPKPKKTYRKRRTNKTKTSTSSMKNSKTKHSSGKENSSVDNVTLKRVPVIHIEGSRENPISVQIINSIKTEEEESSDSKAAAKRKSGKNDRPIKRSATDYVLKNYDPSSSDASWVCVFCKLCAHYIDEAGEPSGDLFGPYFIRDPDRGENERLVVAEHARKKQKRSTSHENRSVDTSLSDEKSMEIWAHENCFVWAPGVHLIGSKLMGLEEAVWDSLKTKCVRCGESGANIGCKVRQCKSFTHYGCAILAGWKLDVEKFLSICNIHAVPD